MLRLAYSGRVFLETGNSPVSMEDTKIYDMLMEIKTKPEKFSKDQIIDLVEGHEIDFLETEDQVKLEFHEELANALCLKAYTPYLPIY